MKVFPKKYLTYALFFVAGSMVSGGAVFASSGFLVQALYKNANIYDSNSPSTTASSQLIYNGASFINTNDLVRSLNNAGVSTAWNGSSLTINNNSSTFIPGLTTPTTTAPNTLTSTLASANSISLFDYPQFAEGTGDQPGSTAIYSSFIDNLGNTYLEPTMSWKTTSATNNSSSSNNYLTLGNTFSQPYASQLLNQHVNYQTFQPSIGSTGTFSKIYNLNNNFSYFSATLAPSAYFNNVSPNNNIGSLEILNASTGSILYYYNDINSNNSSPIQVMVPLYNINQIEIIFTTDGVGLINPQLIKN